jgi:hypothetical protein
MHKQTGSMEALLPWSGEKQSKEQVQVTDTQKGMQTGKWWTGRWADRQVVNRQMGRHANGEQADGQTGKW